LLVSFWGLYDVIGILSEARRCQGISAVKDVCIPCRRSSALGRRLAEKQYDSHELLHHRQVVRGYAKCSTGKELEETIACSTLSMFDMVTAYSMLIS
jgi:hypothetical protein